MKKSKKIILRSMPIVMACLTIVTMLTTMPVYAVTSGVDPNYPTGGNQFTTVSTLGGSLWSTITLIAQIAAFAAIIFAGLRYMFASADQKADIKKQTIIWSFISC